MKDLFGEDTYIAQRGRIDFDDYEAFVEKFKPKKTTDDCYTPPEIYSAVLDYVKSKCDLSRKRVLRPFVPGGDYTAINYKANDVVIDNPPFSILSQIVSYYIGHNIGFFLFAPTLTLLSATKLRCTSIVCGSGIVYENGASVNTSFVTNLFGDCALIVDGELYADLEQINKRLAKQGRKSIKGKSYPDCITTAALLEKIAKRGLCLTFTRDSMAYITKLDCGIALFGGGVILSERAAAEKAAAERAAVERAAVERAFLSEREKALQKKLL